MKSRNTQDNIKFGLEREEANKARIEYIFNLKLTHSYFKYQHFDFYDSSKFVVIEHKSYGYPYHIDNWTLLKSNKILNSNSLFIFEFKNLLSSKRLNQNQGKTEDYELFYLQYSTQIFKTFEKQYIKYANKIAAEEFIVIENKYLTPIYDSPITIKLKPKNNEYITQLITNDEKHKNDNIDYKLEFIEKLFK